jgi:S-DNA-T family DNA segregation ATPase FtsK/SpoIIIE
MFPLLNPSSYVDGEVLVIKLPRSTCGGWPRCRALLVERGSTVAVRVPLLARADAPPRRVGIRSARPAAALSGGRHHQSGTHVRS